VREPRKIERKINLEAKQQQQKEYMSKNTKCLKHFSARKKLNERKIES
jgi:hypothetical protein